MVVTWGKLAEQCNQFLTKGRLVYLEGRLRTHTWDGQDGQKHFRNEIVASRVSFLEKQGAGPEVERQADSGMTEPEPEDIPF